MDGVIVVDKPGGLTSHDVVNRVRRIAQTRKVGHLGTLDPMATGVLPLVLNRATRLAQFFAAGEKRYDAVVRFGWATDTYDREGAATSAAVEPTFTREELEEALNAFRGTFLQTPPSFSAKKVAGTPSYKLARKNAAVELQAVEVTVHGLELKVFGGDTARLLVHCSAGTYVRGIAHDLGARLGCGAFLDALRRTASGEFAVEHSYTLEQLEALAISGDLEQAMLRATGLLPEIPNTTVDALTASQIRQGKDFRLSPFLARSEARYVKAIDEAGVLVAIGEARLPFVYHPILVL